MIDLDLDELERLHKAATLGDWRTYTLDQEVQIWRASEYIGETRDYTGDDAASIVALHNAAPELIAAARERDALRSVLKWRPSRCDYDSLSAYDDAVRNWELQARAALKETSHDH